MRAPFCNEASNLSSDEKEIMGSDSKNQICVLEKSKPAVFGICIEDLLKKSSVLVPQIPFIISRICSYIELHGMHEKCLFVDGEEKALVKKLMQEFAISGDAPLENTGHIASIAKLLVIILEKLPEPLIPESAQSDFIRDIEKLPLDVSDCLQSLKGSLEKLPDCAYQTLKYLSHFLLQVAFHEKHNGLSSNNLAVIFGPLIFRPSSEDKQMILNFQDITNCFVKDYHAIFEGSMKPSNNTLSKLLKKKPPSVAFPLSVVIPVMENERRITGLLAERDPLSIDTSGDRCSINEIGVVITRKRKERRFSGEDGQPRSSSEERPNSLLIVDMLRRCSSHEEVVEEQNKESPTKTMSNDDFQSTKSCVIGSPHPPTAKRREIERTTDEDDYSWNSGEVVRPSYLGHVKQNSVAESAKPNNMECDELDNEDETSEQSFKLSTMTKSASFPVLKVETSEPENCGLSLSWSMLFEDSEPVRAEPHFNLSNRDEEESLLSPSVQSLRKSNYYEAPLSPSAYRNYLSYRSNHLDPSVPPSPPVEQEDFAKKFVENNSAAESIRQLTKKIHCIKKRIRKYEEKFEAEFGFKPSHADKSNNTEGRKMLNDLYKARKELKALKEESHLEHAGSAWNASVSTHILEDTTNQFPHEVSSREKSSKVEDYFGLAVRTLADNRKLANRPESFEEMTTDQVVDEKVAIQKALLNLEEKMNGKPATKEQKDTCRPLYDRYRFVKRLLVRSGSFPATKNKDLCSELQPILEHETMNFPSCFNNATSEKDDADESTVTRTEDSEEKSETTREEPKNFLAMKYDNSSLHELPLSEMILQMAKIKSEKRHLRKIIKDFETEFLRLNSRKVQKEDRVPIECIYNEYKHVKARLKLLEALVSKHDQHQFL